MKRLLLVFIGSLLCSSVFAAGIGSSNPADISGFIQNHSALLYLSVFFGLGILLAFTPCVLPMVPILSGIITGQHEKGSKQAFKLSLGYVLGMAVTYAIAGMLASWFGSTVQTLMQQPAVIITFSVIFVLMAFWLLGWFEIRLPSFLQLKQQKITSGNRGVVSAALMGSLSTLVVSPCVTAPLIGILTYIAQSGQVLQGGLILFVLALGMGVPLLMVGAGYGKIIPSTGPWMVRIKQIFAVMMLAMAVWLASRILPSFWISISWALMLFVSALIIGMSHGNNQRFAQWVRGVAVVFLLFSGAMLHKAFFPVEIQKTGEHQPVEFVSVHTLNELQRTLADARQSGKPAFIEFFADWCSDCKAMDQKVFNQADVKKAMRKFVNIRVDISQKTDQVEAIKSAYGIYGIPTMLFVDTKGAVLENLTSVGQISKSKTISLLEKTDK